MNYEYSQHQADTTIGAMPLAPASSRELLNKILAMCSGMRVFFDLDSTLLNNRPRNAAIMREFGKEENLPQLVKATADDFPDWNVRNSLGLLGIDAIKRDSLLPRYHAFWGQRFFTSEYCQYDVAVPGAVEFVCAVANTGGQVSYLTGRHEAMRAGTFESLLSLGFPEPACLQTQPSSRGAETGDAVELIMKAEFSESDDGYKEKALANPRSGRRVVAAFDNEPSHINTYRRAFPQAFCVHLLTDHSMRNIQLLDGIFSIVDFVHRGSSEVTI